MFASRPLHRQGLILLVQSDPRFVGTTEIVITVGLAALAINQLLGPSAARLSLQRAGEAGKGHPSLLDFLEENHIVVEPPGTTKEQIIAGLANRLYATPNRPSVPKDEFVRRVLEQEDRQSSCLWEGLMIPHAILEEGKEITGVLGISPEGIALGAPDGQPIHAISLLATPKAIGIDASRSWPPSPLAWRSPFPGEASCQFLL